MTQVSSRLRELSLLRRGVTFSVLIALLQWNGLALPPAQQDTVREPDVWTTSWGNDLFLFEDDGFTNAFSLAWQSGALSTRPRSSYLRRMIDAVSFLPGIGGEGREHFVAFEAGQSMFTATDLSDPNPPLDDQPYAGILFLDTSVHARREESAHTYTLRLGILGPSSRAEEAQKLIHKVTGSQEPKGWDTQLHDEFVINLSYEYRRRWFKGDFWDITPSVAGVLGNYSTLANGALVARAGWNLSNGFGSSVELGPYNPEALAAAPRDLWQFYGFGALQGYATARQLQLDGNTFKSSRSVEKEPFFGIASVGASLAKGAFRVEYVIAWGSKTFETQRNSPRFGVISLSWYM